MMVDPTGTTGVQARGLIEAMESGEVIPHVYHFESPPT
jgi:hypothetical protein